MATGACGIDCTVCRLHVSGICSACGAGNSRAGKDKLDAQYRLFGSGCQVLTCAVERKIGYCLRDCDQFPCEKFSSGPFPFSEDFMKMQRRRREQIGAMPTASWPDTTPRFWEILRAKEPAKVCKSTGATLTDDGKYRLKSLNDYWLIDTKQKNILKSEGEFGGEWDRQLPFLVLVYMAMAKEEPLSGDMVAPRDLTVGHDFFQERYKLETEDLQRAFGENGDAFLVAAKKLEGVTLEEADVAARLNIFPKFVADYLVWLKDEEFPAYITILLDSNLPTHYPMDATAVTINLLSRRLLLAKKSVA